MGPEAVSSPRVYDAGVIRKISFLPEFLAPLGLPNDAQTMDRLGRLVVLAGPNGAGKTRYLALLEQEVNEIQQLLAQAAMLEAMHVSPEAREIPTDLARTLPKVGFIGSHGPERLAQIRSARGYRARVHQGFSHLGNERVVRLTYALAKQGIQRTDAIAPNVADGLTRDNLSPGFEQAHKSMHAYFTHVARALWTAGDPRRASLHDVAQDRADAEAFNQLLDLLVGGTIEPAHDHNHHLRPLFRGRPFAPIELSDGEAVLVTWAIILHRQKDALADSIVLIDEPENHLHPDASIKALRVLRDQILLGPHGQIWLATHSVQLIAFAGMDAVWLVDGGRVEYAGSKVDKVIERLLGGEEGRDQLRAFLADADDLGFYKFAAECLTDPGVVGSRVGDPQEAQFTTSIQAHLHEGQPLRVLDYGAGKGRLAAALRDALAQRGAEAGAAALAYHAYNGPRSAEDEAAACRARIADLGAVPGVTARYVDDLRALTLPAEPKMDRVVLCNVLHEVPVERWLATFRDIADVLSPDGWLLLMEDQRMTIGELPTAHGFVVLDAIEVAALFGARPGEDVRELPTAYGGRLTQIVVAARVVRNSSAATIASALDHVQRRARAEVEKLRDENAQSFQAGRQHAYYSMLHLNATLARRAFG